MNLDAHRFLEDLTGRYARAYTAALTEMMAAKATGIVGAQADARTRLAKVVNETMGIAEVLGASMALRKASAAIPQVRMNMADAAGWDLLRFAAQPLQTLLPRVTLSDAVQEMVDRAPVTIKNAAERTAQRISELYSEGRVTAFVRAAEEAVTFRAQQLITNAIERGLPEVDVGRRIVRAVKWATTETAEWTEGYARMAFRTN